MINQIKEKVKNGQRLSVEEGIYLLSEADLMTIGQLANQRRKTVVGDEAYFQYNYNINYTNVCENECRLCAFYKDETRGYTLTPEQITEKVRLAHQHGVNEVHIVGGLNKKLPFSYYVEMMQAIKAIDPNICIQGFTAVEIEFLAQNFGKTSREVLTELQAAGLGTLPGGGAEVFSERVRKEICEKKASAEIWLRVHREAHELGMATNATMLYGHVETLAEIIDHMDRLRRLQDETGGFRAFVPLSFFPANTEISHLANPRGGQFDLRLMATARLFLDNFDHLKSLWMIYGYKGAQVGLDFGADDIGGTYFNEEIVHAAGAETPDSASHDEILELMQRMGRTPVMVDSFYNPIEVMEAAR